MTRIELQVDDNRMGLIRQRAEGRGFPTPEAYIQSLLDEDLGSAGERELKALLLERANDPVVTMTDDAFRDMHAAVEAKIRAGAAR